MNVTECEYSLTAAAAKRNCAPYGVSRVHQQGVVRQFRFVQRHNSNSQTKTSPISALNVPIASCIVPARFRWQQMPADSTTISFQSVLCCDADIRKNLHRWHDHGPVDWWVRDEEMESVGSIHDEFFFEKKK